MPDVRWRVHFASPPVQVWELLATDDGRARFWAEEAVERDGRIAFRFPNGQAWDADVLEREPGRRLAVDYFGTPAAFALEPDGSGGTELTLTQEVPDDSHIEVNAGWVSVLMSLKAACDHGVDLRNHHPERTWDQGYCDN